jgi:hypothetical protein
MKNKKLLRLVAASVAATKPEGNLPTMSKTDKAVSPAGYSESEMNTDTVGNPTVTNIDVSDQIRTPAKGRPLLLQRINKKLSPPENEPARGKEVRVLPEAIRLRPKIQPSTEITKQPLETIEASATTNSPISTIPVEIPTTAKLDAPSATNSKTTVTIADSALNDVTVDSDTKIEEEPVAVGRKRKVVLNYFPTKIPSTKEDSVQIIQDEQLKAASTTSATTQSVDVSVHDEQNKSEIHSVEGFFPGANRVKPEITTAIDNEVQNLVETRGQLSEITTATTLTTIANITAETTTAATTTTIASTIAPLTTATTENSNTNTSEVRRPKVFFNRGELKEKLKGVVLSVIQDPQTATLQQKVCLL